MFSLLKQAQKVSESPAKHNYKKQLVTIQYSLGLRNTTYNFLHIDLFLFYFQNSVNLLTKFQNY